MMNCGLRISEALSLDLYQVNLDALRFHGVMRKGRVREDVVMNHAVADSLERWLLYRDAYKKDPEAAAALFLSDRGTRLSARAVQRSFAGYVTAAGLTDRHLTPHSLRHSCATALVAKGATIEVVAELLNHKKLDTTRIYVRIAGRQKQAAVALLDEPSHGKVVTIRAPRSAGSGPRHCCLTSRKSSAESELDLARNGSSVTSLHPV